MKEKLQDDLKTAMRAGEKIRLMTIRGVLAEISRVEKDVRREPNEAEIIQVIKRERGRREESLEFARRAARTDLIEQYEAEARVLDTYLPTIVGVDEVTAVVAEQIAAGANQIGPIMKALRDKFGSRLDGKIASELIKQSLTTK